MKVIIIAFLSILLFAMRCTAKEEYPMASVDLINKRLTIEMPKGSKIEGRGYDIMSAPEPDTKETRVVFDDGKKRLVLIAEEIFKTAGKKFEEKAIETLRTWGEYEKSKFTTRKIGEGTIIGIPDSYNTEDEAILYSAVFVRNFDNTVIRLAVYFNPEFHKENTIAQALAEKIIKSIKPGSRKLNTTEDTEVFNIFSDQYKLAIDFHGNFCHYTQIGPDFLVHRVLELVEFGSNGKSISIYVGNHPGYHHREYGPGELNIETADKELFGKKIPWIIFSTKNSTDEFNAETITGIPYLNDDYLKIHIFCNSITNAGLDDIFKILKSAEIKKKKA
jgi:hypothetical protein